MYVYCKFIYLFLRMCNIKVLLRRKFIRYIFVILKNMNRWYKCLILNDYFGFLFSLGNIV